ncbi:hypothetical protein VP14_001 [Vibrio phage VPMCC14]|nr:hypothetical protein VP14_001 [Vibrio phage VPMCC14]
MDNIFLSLCLLIMVITQVGYKFLPDVNKLKDFYLLVIISVLYVLAYIF